MHKIDIDLVEMTLDVMKYTIDRISKTEDVIGKPQKAETLKALVGETITEKGIGGETAFNMWKKHLMHANVKIDHPRHLAFVPASPTRASILFDLVTSASSIHGAYWMEGAGGIFCENEAVSDFIKLTIPELVCSYDATDFTIYDLLIFSMGYINRKIMKEDAETYWVQL